MIQKQFTFFSRRIRVLVPRALLCLWLVACGSDSPDDDDPPDAAVASDAAMVASDAAVDARVVGLDAMPSDYTLTLSPGVGGSISATVDSLSVGSCPETQTCIFDIEADAIVTLKSNLGTLRHCSWTGDCAGFGSSTNCLLVMDQAHGAGANYDAADADCP